MSLPWISARWTSALASPPPPISISVPTGDLLVSDLVVSDNFNRADGGLGSAYTTIVGYSVPEINSNSVIGTATGSTFHGALYTDRVFTDSQYVQATVSVPGLTSQAGVVVLSDSDRGNAYTAFLAESAGTGTLRVTQIVGFVSTTLLTVTGLATSGVVRLEVFNQVLRVYFDGTLRVTKDVHSPVSGAPGIFVFKSSTQASGNVDNVEFGNMSTAPVVARTTPVVEVLVFDQMRRRQTLNAAVRRPPDRSALWNQALRRRYQQPPDEIIHPPELELEFLVDHSRHRITIDVAVRSTFVRGPPTFAPYLHAQKRHTVPEEIRRFPWIASTFSSNFTSPSSPQSLTLPAGIVSGDLLILWAEAGGASALTLSAGWSLIAEQGNGPRLNIWARLATGSDATTIQTTPTFSNLAYAIARIVNHGVTSLADAPSVSDIAVTAAASGASTSPDPPSLTVPRPGDWLWLESSGFGIDSPSAVYWSTDYGPVLTSAGTNGNVMVGGRNLTATTEDPGVMHKSGSQTSRTYTLAIPPFGINVPVGVLTFSGLVPDIGNVNTDALPLQVDQSRRRETLNVATRRDLDRSAPWRYAQRRYRQTFVDFLSSVTIPIPPGDLVLAGDDGFVSNIDVLDNGLPLYVDQNRRRSALDVAVRRPPDRNAALRNALKRHVVWEGVFRYPYVIESATTSIPDTGAIGTPFAFNIPAGVEAGDLLLAYVGAIPTSGTRIEIPDGWHLIAGAGSSNSIAVFGRISDGADPASILLGNSANRDMAVIVHRVVQHGVRDLKNDITAGGGQSGNSTIPDPANVTMLIDGVAPSPFLDYLVIEAVVSNTAVPADAYASVGYSELSRLTVDAASVATASRDITTPSENPGTMLLATSNFWFVSTIAIPPVNSLSIDGWALRNANSNARDRRSIATAVRRDPDRNAQARNATARFRQFNFDLVATTAQSIDIPPGDLVLVGVEPTVAGTGTATIAIPAGVLTIDGVAPTVAGTGTATIPIPPGVITIDGVAPVVTTAYDPPLITDINRRRWALAAAGRRGPPSPAYLHRVRRLDVNLIAFPQTILIPNGDITFATDTPPTVDVGLDPALLADQNRRRSTLAVATRRIPARFWVRKSKLDVNLVAYPQTITIPPADLVLTGVEPVVTTNIDPTLVVDQNRRRQTLAVATRRLPARPLPRARRLDVNLLAYAQTITIPPGDLVLTGVEPTVTTGFDLSTANDVNRRRSTLATAVRRVPARIWPRSRRDTVALIAYPQTILVPPADLVFTGVEPGVTAGMDIALIYDQGRRRTTVNTATRRAIVQRPAPRRQSQILGEAQTITIPPGDLTLTGIAPTITAPATIPVPPGIITFTGVEPTVSTSIDPGLYIDINRRRSTIAVAARRLPARLHPRPRRLDTNLVAYPQTILVPNADLVFTGVAPTLSGSGTTSILEPTGALTITGVAPFVSSTGGFNVQVPTGQVVLTGVEPVVSTGMDPSLYVDVNRRRSTIAVAVRRLPARFWVRLRRLDPNLIAFPQTITIPPADLTFTGVAPVVTATGTATILAPVGALTVTGVAPAVTATGTATILLPVGPITFEGIAPVVLAGDDPIYAIDAGAAYRQAVNTAARRDPDRSAPWRYYLNRYRRDRQGALLASAVAAGIPLVPNFSGREQLQVRLVAGRRVVSTAAQYVMARRFHQAPPAGEAQTIPIPPADLTLVGVEPIITATGTATILAPVADLTFATDTPPVVSVGMDPALYVDTNRRRSTLAVAVRRIPPRFWVRKSRLDVNLVAYPQTIVVPPADLTFATDTPPTVTAGMDIALIYDQGRRRSTRNVAVRRPPVRPVQRIRRVGSSILGAPSTIVVPPADLTFLGVAPTVSGTGTRSIVAPTGVLTLSGVAPQVAAFTRITVPPAALTITGVAPIITAGSVTILIPSGTLIVAGRAPTITGTGTATILAPTGNLTITGVPPVVTGAASANQIPPAALTIVGVAPIITATGSGTVLVPTGQLTITGRAPSVAGSGLATSIPVPPGVLVLTGVPVGVLFRGTVDLETLVPTCTLEVLVPTLILDVLAPTVSLVSGATIVTLTVLAPTVTLTQSAD
jgi:hypothetical protein